MQNFGAHQVFVAMNFVRDEEINLVGEIFIWHVRHIIEAKFFETLGPAVVLRELRAHCVCMRRTV